MASEHRIEGCGVQLQVTTRGPQDAPAIVLVHGYPDNQTVWNAVAEHLARDWFVVTYDVRGAGRSQRPQRTRDYRLPLLARDLEAVVDTVLADRAFHLVGHDWGSIQCWESVTGERLRARIRSFTSISGPCLDHVGHWFRHRLGGRSLREHWKVARQAASSWYIGAFHLPWLAATLWRSRLGGLWPQYLAASEGIRPGADNPWQSADGRDGIRLYRANMLPRLLNPRVRYAHCPVQVIVPERDRYVGAQLFDDLHEWVPALFRRELDAGHWAPLSHPRDLACDIDEFVASIESQHTTPRLEASRVTTRADAR
ncbi:alpha/beta fold hydrolase [Marinobacter bohaiensis]|uniref:alpha/beta fold hydrolase n=1 Tax=Marinobacter bohaiensis TaxID=2201898 RepID=UPI000DADB809|nr:alpha/beta fold hydrolase [Marinobacter bohaiensis]